MARRPFRDLVSFAIGGGWGILEPKEGFEPVAVIRGTDFPKVELGDVSSIPHRFESVKRVKTRRLDDGDILLEISGGSQKSDQHTGRSLFIDAVILEQFEKAVIPASFCRLLRADKKVVRPRYAYYLLREMYVSGRVAGYENPSTGISNFQYEHFLDAEIVELPDLDRQDEILELLQGLDTRARALSMEGISLRQIRDSLLAGVLTSPDEG